MTGRPGMILSEDSLGVVSVWMNIVRTGKGEGGWIQEGFVSEFMANEYDRRRLTLLSRSDRLPLYAPTPTSEIP